MAKKATQKALKKTNTEAESPPKTAGKKLSGKVEITATVITPYDIFLKCIKRAANLINFHKESENETGKEEHYCDAYRAAIVLSISALDAFIRTLVIERVKKILLDKKPLNPELRDYLKNLLNQDKLLDAARDYNLLEIVEKALRDDFEKKSFQGDWKISSFMKLVGHSEIFKQISIKAELNETTMTQNINKFTKRRHIIAHSGDYSLNETMQTENGIDKKYAKDCIDLVSKFAETLNEITETR